MLDENNIATYSIFFRNENYDIEKKEYPFLDIRNMIFSIINTKNLLSVRIIDKSNVYLAIVNNNPIGI